MNAIELLDIISSGETSRVQFKREIGNDNSIAAELIALSNSKGGIILFGIEDKTGKVVGLDYQQLQSFNNRLATTTSEKVKPEISIDTEVVTVSTNDGEKKVLIVHVSEGISKPYKDKDGAIWVKRGSDKRRVTDSNELLRLFQQSGLLHMDEMTIPETSVDEVELTKVEEYMKAIHKRETEVKTKITESLLNNLNIMKTGRLTLGGLLVFAKYPQKYKPVFCVKAVSFFGNSLGGSDYRSSKDIEGTIPEIFEETMQFFTSNLNHIQAGQNFNSTGKLEVSQTALEELLQNALVHRDYSRNSPVRVMIFDNRIEIVSPGSLPNSLTIENIKMGHAAVRNNLIASYCSKLMIYRGFGSGIIRALENQPDIELINEEEGGQFKAIIPRPERIK